MLSVRIIDEQVPIIAVEGEIKAANKNEIEQAINLVLKPTNNQLILDVTDVRSLDAGETEVIIEATHRALGAGGRLAIVATEKDIEHAIKESRVANTPGVFIFRNRKEAMDFLGERGLGASTGVA